MDDGRRIPDALWERIEPLLPPEPPHPNGGRPWQPARQMTVGKEKEGFRTRMRSVRRLPQELHRAAPRKGEEAAEELTETY